MAYAFLVEGGDEKSRQKLDAQLNAPVEEIEENRRGQVLLAGGELG